jgi:hypothetical protein
MAVRLTISAREDGAPAIRIGDRNPAARTLPAFTLASADCGDLDQFTASWRSLLSVRAKNDASVAVNDSKGRGTVSALEVQGMVTGSVDMDYLARIQAEPNLLR